MTITEERLVDSIKETIKEHEFVTIDTMKRYYSAGRKTTTEMCHLTTEEKISYSLYVNISDVFKSLRADNYIVFQPPAIGGFFYIKKMKAQSKNSNTDK